MKKRMHILAIAATLTFTMAFASGAGAMLSDDEQREAYVKKAVEKAIGKDTEAEAETKAEAEEKLTEKATEKSAETTEKVTEKVMEDVMEISHETETETEAETETETETETESETETETETERESSSEKKEKIIVAIDPGHQAPGADLEETEPVGPGSDEMKPCRTEGSTGCVSGLGEYELNLDVALLLRDELENRGYEVVLTRETNDTDLSNKERAELVNKSGANVVIRLHADDNSDPEHRGAIAMAPTSDNTYTTDICELSNSLSYMVLNKYCEETGLNNRGLWLVDEMTATNWSKVPVCLLELGCMSNSQDDAYMADKDNQKIMAKAIADGIDLYYYGS